MSRADNITTFMCQLSWNVGASTYWNPQGLSRPVMGLLYLLILLFGRYIWILIPVYPTILNHISHTQWEFNTLYKAHYFHLFLIIFEQPAQSNKIQTRDRVFNFDTSQATWRSGGEGTWENQQTWCCNPMVCNVTHLMLWPFLYYNMLSTWDPEVNRSEWSSYIK